MHLLKSKTLPWFLFLALLVCLTACLPTRFIVYNFADINDHKKFPSRKLEPAKKPFTYAQVELEDEPTLTAGTKKQPLAQYLNASNTVAFLIIRQDTIVYERYFRGRDSSSTVPSFSVAKSFTSALIGCAIEDGLIGSVTDPIIKYVPELKGRNMDDLTLRQVLMMRSGIRFNESYYNPFGDAAKYYYGRRLRHYVTHMRSEKPPGSRFQYHSGNTQLLGLVLERALKGKTVTQYLQEKVWTPLTMESPASWSIDKKKNGLEKTFCCINATARDFAKFGTLYLHGGSWQGRQVVPASWVQESTQADKAKGDDGWYKYQWWLTENSKQGEYMAQGTLGQYIYVNPARQVVIVRLGKDGGGTNWEMLFSSIANKYGNGEQGQVTP